MRVSIYDTIILQQYFANKREPSSADKERAAKLDGYICELVDGMKQMYDKEKLGIPEIFERLTGERLDDYK